MSNIFNGQMKKVRWVNTEHTWGITVMADNTTVCGQPPADGWEIGAEYLMAGRWVETEKYGRQFHYTTITMSHPVTEQGVKAYLKKTCEGIGPAISQRLWDTYGEQACEMLRTNPDVVALAIAGLSTEKAAAASEVLRSRYNLEKVNIELSSLLDGYGFRSTVYNEVVEKWGVDAPRRIRTNPFILLIDRISSVGFRRVDKLFCDLNRGSPAKLASTKRLAIAGWWTLRHDTSGHTWYNVSKIAQALRELPGAGDFDLVKIVKLLYRAKWIDCRKHEGQLYVTDMERSRCERDVARMITDHLCAPLAPYLYDNFGELSQHQDEQARLALSTPIGILCGTPGTGKTYTLAGIVKNMMSDGLTVAVAAPTGKAGVRCTAAMRSCGLELSASTVHTLLGPDFKSGTMKFSFNQYNPLPLDCVIIDEASMLDMPLFKSLLLALSPMTRLILVGDPYQLPPVNWGQPMNDLIKQGKIGIGELTEIHRNSGGIVAGCRQIKSGNLPEFSSSFKEEDPTTNLLFIPASDDRTILKKLQGSLFILTKQGISMSDIQVIVPTNASSILGRHNLNKVLQNQLNPDGYCVEGNRFRVGDKAIILKNKQVAGMAGNIHPDLIREWGEIYVANGDVGTVVKVNSKHTFIQLTTPSRVIRVGPAVVKEEEVEAKGDRLAEPRKESESTVEVDLAYAITGHKSQGSGYPYVFILLDPSFGAQSVTSRQWLYTGTSRGEKLTAWLGNENVAKKMIDRIANSRLSFLIEYIDELLPEECIGEDSEYGVDLPVQNRV